MLCGSGGAMLLLNGHMMRACHRYVGHAVRAALLCALLCAPALAAANEASGTPVIPPGQEELLATMLGKGAVLPDECKLADAEVDHTTIKAKYTCPGGEVVFELAHPSTGAP